MTLTTILTDTTDEVTPLTGRPFTAAFAQPFGNSLKGWRSTTFNPLSRPWADYAARVPLVRRLVYLPDGLKTTEYSTGAFEAELATKIAYRCYLRSADSGEDANISVTPRLEAEKTQVRGEVRAQSWTTIDQGPSQNGAPSKIVVHEVDAKWTLLRVTADVASYSGTADPVGLVIELWGEANRSGLNPRESEIAEREAMSLEQNDQINDLNSVRETLS